MSELKRGRLALVAHPDTPARAVTSVECSYAWRGPGEWEFNFLVEAPPGALKLPAPATAERADGLWQHTCFEVFLRDPANGACIEFNFSPSGQWAAYEFDGYRSGMRDLPVHAPRIIGTSPRVAQAPRYGLDARLEHPGLWRDIDCRAGVSAVIEEPDGTRSYWALAHPPGKPDFHHADCFVLDLPRTSRG